VGVDMAAEVSESVVDVQDDIKKTVVHNDVSAPEYAARAIDTVQVGASGHPGSTASHDH
jgi:hypothetical protein